MKGEDGPVTAIMERELEVIFARASRRMTTPRKEIFRVFQNSNEPLSVATISTQCSNIDRTSVYRTIELFIQLNVVKPVQLGWRQRYELADPFKSHHHHLSCTKCNQLVDLQSSQFENIVGTIAKQHGFVVTDHTFEMRGLCSDCR